MAIDVKRHVASSVFDTAACKEGAVLGHRGGGWFMAQMASLHIKLGRKKEVQHSEVFQQKKAQSLDLTEVDKLPFF